MRTIGRLASGLAAATLMVAGTVLVAGAQSPANSPASDRMAAASVTGRLGPVDLTPDYSAATAQDVTSSDLRLGGVYRDVTNGVTYPEGIGVNASRIEFRDDHGAWVGTGTGYTAESDLETLILTGEGAYTGLTAYLILDWGTPGRPFKGIIFPGEMPEPPPTP